ncbi:C40 family peptidase [Cohnella faecalis]|uniref:NlpC/P60 family protein n=1 Tax=Cohnella faecalis TaxID=2315694 RepID=A0A398CM62_9BACL|nr:C40 family peptidase [Cohnella faecalis]RIE03535.1 NlpC/P60 family protein [Cohnella faecalis]
MKKQLAKWALMSALVTTGWFGFAAIGGTPQASAATAESMELLANGKELVGTAYKFGAPTGITYAFDCSSFVKYVFEQSGLELPRTSVAQSKVGDPVAKAYLSVGDLVFFNTGGSGISHVAIYAGSGKILHASSSKGVTVSSMNTSYWTKAYVTARRVL